MEKPKPMEDNLLKVVYQVKDEQGFNTSNLTT